MSQYSKLERNLCYPLMVSLLLFIKILSHQLFGKSSFPINTTLETMKCDLFKHKLFQKNSPKMWWAIVMCKMHHNSAPKMDFRHVLRCVCDHTFSHQAWGLVHITLFWFSSPKIEVYCSGLSYSEPTENFQKNLVGCLRWHANTS